MIKDILSFLRAYFNGEDAELNIDKEFVVSWPKVAVIALTVGIFIYLLCR